MLFTHELEIRRIAAVQAEEKPNLEHYLELLEGEEIVGFIDDLDLLGLVAVRDNAIDNNFKAKFLQQQPAPFQQKINAVAKGSMRAMNNALQYELQRAFVDSEDIPLAIRRKGNALVAVKSGAAPSSVQFQVLVRLAEPVPAAVAMVQSSR